MDIKLKSNKKLYVTNIVAFLVMVIMSIGIFNLYPSIKEWIKDEPSVPYENYEFLRSIYNSNIVLYKDILEQEKGEELSGDEVYIKSYGENAPSNNSINESINQEDSQELTGDEAYVKSYKENINSYDNVKRNINNDLNTWKSDLNGNLKNLEYLVYIDNSSIKKTNTNSDLSLLVGNSENESLKNNYAWFMAVKYDQNGGVSITNIYGADDYAIRNRFSEFNMRETWAHSFQEENNIKFNSIKNTTFIYGIPKDLKYSDSISRIINSSLNNVNDAAFEFIVLIILFSILILGLLVPYRKGIEIAGIKVFLKIPLEINCFIFGFGAIFLGLLSSNAIIDTLQNTLIQNLVRSDIKQELKNFITIIVNIIVWTITIYAIFAGDMLLKHIFNIGLVKYLKENLLIIKLCKALKKWTNNLIYYVEHIDLSDKSNKVIIKVLVINFLVVSAICITWFFGILVTLIYSIVLFMLIRKYIDRVKNKFSILLNVTNKIANGNLDIKIDEDLGLFNPIKENITKIQEGLKKAVNEEVKSQRMKTELISNVSHDLKTPLTSIITYADLLKKDNITDEQRKSYIDTIDKKSQRLKFLIEDLFEVSKATSGDIKLNLVNVDIIELMRQTQIELDDKIKKSNLNIKNNFPENKVILELDSQKTFRIFENLLINVVKYAMEGSRVYVDMTDSNDTIEITIKNMSAEEINFDPFDIVERFQRGDKSRNTEGSGLGLAIAKSFVEVQGGKFNIEVDGDLFKVIILFKKLAI